MISLFAKPLLFFTVVSGIMLNSCVAPYLDPQYEALLAHVESNPQPTRILGLWHRRDDSGGNWAVDIKTRTTMLFRSDGTALSRSVMRSNGQETNVYSGTLSWTYRGSGIWETVSSNGVTSTYRYAKGKILMSHGGHKYVLERVN